MTNQRSKRGVALAAVLFAIVGILIGTPALLWQYALPKTKLSAPKPPIGISVDPARYTAPAPSRSELSEEQVAAAVALNAANPVIPGARVTAAPFFFDPVLSPIDRVRAEYCLTLAIYYEAGTETPSGQRAVAQVVLNRVRHPLYPQTVCGVVFQGSERTTGCQFTFTCDGALARRPTEIGWRRAASVAAAALAGIVEPSVGTATHYHTDWVVPVWRTELVKIAQIGTHIFYRWPGRMGSTAGFAMRYRGGEIIGALGVPMLPPVNDTALIGGVGDVLAPVSVNQAATDGPSRLRPAPLSADDTQRSRLRADDERGTLRIGEREVKLRH